MNLYYFSLNNSQKNKKKKKLSNCSYIVTCPFVAGSNKFWDLAGLISVICDNGEKPMTEQRWCCKMGIGHIMLICFMLSSLGSRLWGQSLTFLFFFIFLFCSMHPLRFCQRIKCKCCLARNFWLCSKLIVSPPMSWGPTIFDSTASILWGNF
jgi:hypothetical protein